MTMKYTIGFKAGTVIEVQGTEDFFARFNSSLERFNRDERTWGITEDMVINLNDVEFFMRSGDVRLIK